LLKVERLGSFDDATLSGPSALLMTFDVGLILVSADPLGRRIETVTIPDAEAKPGGLTDASEEEPWWRLLGCALASATSDSPDAIRLEFRISGGSTRLLGLERTGGSLTLALTDAP
jgi:hypothetical protein